MTPVSMRFLWELMGNAKNDTDFGTFLTSMYFSHAFLNRIKTHRYEMHELFYI